MTLKTHSTTIENRYGKISFKEPIIISYDKIEKSIKIEQNLVDFMSERWKSKDCSIVLYNYRNYDQIKDEKQRK